MGWFGRKATFTSSAEVEAREAAWGEALARGSLPQPVIDRLSDAFTGKAPWVATMTPAELLAARSHGVRPIATVTGTCWYQFGRSWTEGHAEGWETALRRIRREAMAAGANAVVDVRMRTIRHRFGPSMDFTLLGTAIRVDGLPVSTDPVIATVPALEFVRLLEMGIVPTGIAIGARFEWLGGGWGARDQRRIGGWGGYGTRWSGGGQLTNWQSSVFAGNQPLTELSHFWESIRRDAHADLRRHAATMGNGVLAHTNFGQIIRQERDKQPPAYLGRHIVVGTVVDTPRGAGVPHGIEPVIDMRDGLSPFGNEGGHRHGAYPTEGEGEGPI